MYDETDPHRAGASTLRRRAACENPTMTSNDDAAGGASATGNGGSDLPPVPPVASGSGRDDDTLPNPHGDATLLPLATATGSGSLPPGSIPPGGPTGPGQFGGPGGDTPGRPAWLLPAGVGLVAGLVIALVAVFAFGGDDEPSADDVLVPSTLLVESTVPGVATTLGEPLATTTISPTETTIDPGSATVPPTEPATTEPATTEPATTEPPPTTSPDGIAAASPGTVRVFDVEYPIVRVCQSTPFVGYSVTSYVYEEGGLPSFIERWFDEGGVSGVEFFDGEADELVDFGADGFGAIVFQGDGGFPVSVNPTGTESGPCAGTIVETDPANPDFPTERALLDVCFGTVFAPDENGEMRESVGYRAVTAEFGIVTALPNAGASLAVAYSAPDASFGGSDPEAQPSEVDAGLRIDATAVGNPAGSYAGMTRTLEITISDALLRDC